MEKRGIGRFHSIHVRNLHAASASAHDGVDDVLVPSIPKMAAGCDTEDISDVEIAYLVSGALKDALVALSKPQPEAWLQLQACETRSRLREKFAKLQRFQANDEAVLNEYRMAMVLQNASLELALNLASSIRRYAKLNHRDVQP